MPIEQIQKFLGHVRLETTQVYAEATAAMIHNSYRKALSTYEYETAPFHQRGH